VPTVQHRLDFWFLALEHLACLANDLASARIDGELDEATPLAELFRASLLANQSINEVTLQNEPLQFADTVPGRMLYPRSGQRAANLRFSCITSARGIVFP
jgi:hypothetical protein